MTDKDVERVRKFIAIYGRSAKLSAYIKMIEFCDTISDEIAERRCGTCKWYRYFDGSTVSMPERDRKECFCETIDFMLKGHPDFSC